MELFYLGYKKNIKNKKQNKKNRNINWNFRIWKNYAHCWWLSIFCAWIVQLYTFNFYSHQNAFSVHAVYVLYLETSTDINVYFSLNVLGSNSNINCRVSVQSYSDPWYLKKMVARIPCAGVMESRSFKNDKFGNNLNRLNYRYHSTHARIFPSNRLI